MHLPGCHLSQHALEITPYCVARHEGRDAVAEYLLEHGAEIDIHTAAYLGDYDAARSCLDNDDSSLVNTGYLQSVMLSSGGPITVEHQYAAWATPLCYAIVGGNIRIVELLIANGAAIESHSEHLLDHAVSEGRVEIVRLLFENGADPNEAPRIYDDNSEMSVLLKSHGVPPRDINAKNGMGWPPLVYACRGDKGEHPEEIERLLKLGADIDVRNSKGKTALHYAAKAGFINVIKLLVEKGVTIDATGSDGETALFEAIRSTIKNREKQLAALEALLIHGANPNVKNRKGLTPLQIAQQLRRTDSAKIVQLLQKYGAA